MKNPEQQFDDQTFGNEYELVDGVAMHARYRDQFGIPPDVIKRHIGPGQFVELRIDSPRFSVHEDDRQNCTCPSCHGELTKPILRHNHPASLVPLPTFAVPSRGWGEDFWVRVTEHSGGYFRGIVDNVLAESRLHGLSLGDEIVFRDDHILAVHDSHRRELVASMDTLSLKELAQWLGDLRRSS